MWSGIFKDSFFGEQANWAKAHNVEYLVHLNHEETMQSLERSEGDFFRDERYVETPGIDNLSQLVPNAVHTPDGTWNINNNFPKLASSAAHLFGKPKVWAEEGGGTGIEGKYQMDFQLVRGVTTLALRVPWTHATAGEPLPANPVVQPQAKMIAMYGNRGGYLMSIGRPAAQVGLYHPGNTIWMGGDAATEADRSTTKLGWQLFEHQVDWDYFDEQSLSSVATLANGGFTNLSGQTYKAIVLPSMTVITRTGLARLKEFAQQGGKVIFVGKTPTLILDKTFMDAKEKPDVSFATLIEASGDITPAVLAALPKPDVKLDAEFQRLTYTHRQFTDGDMYFFFNESNKAESRVATLAGHGKAQDWDLATGEIHPLSAATAEGDGVKVPLVLGPYEAKVIVVGPLAKKGVAAAPEPSFAAGETVCDAGWRLEAGPERKADDDGAEAVGGAGHEWVLRAGDLYDAVHRSQSAQGEACVPGDRRCARLREGDAQRKGRGRVFVAAVSLGRDGRTEEGGESSGNRGGCAVCSGPRRLWRTAAGCSSCCGCSGWCGPAGLVLVRRELLG